MTTNQTPSSVPFYSNGDGISKIVIDEKYCKDGEIKATVAESKEAIYRRVAKGAAKAELPAQRRKWERRFFKNMMENEAIGGGRIMSNVGSNVGGTAINCFVQGVGDSISVTEDEKHPAIYVALMKAAESMRRGGGVGYNFSRIRPANAYVKGTSSSASGPCSYINVFDSSCSTVESKGARRGAQLGTLVVSHPDIEEFIDAKKEEGRWSNFNVSVAVTDEFMEAVRKDGSWDLVHKCRPTDELIEAGAYYDEKRDVWIYRIIRATDLWEKIMRATYDYAEPGILYIDTINRLNNLGYIEVIESTNPCGEQPLPPDGCCCLGPINLSNYVVKPFVEGSAWVDFKRLEEAVAVQVRFLDNILDVTLWPHEEQRQEAMNKRRIGLGITGLDDMLKKLCLHYGTQGARDKATVVMRAIANAAYKASVDLAIEKGAFPLFDADKYLAEEHFVHRIDDDIKDQIRKHGIRNSHLLSIAPTGTTSLAFFDSCAGGLEPTFDFGHNRRKRMADGSSKTYFVAAAILNDYLNHLVSIGQQDTAAVIYNAYVKEDVAEIKRVRAELLPHYFVTALELSVDEHLEMVKVIQYWNDTACSKTVNVPTDYPYEDFKDLYLKAHAVGLKGISTYRPNSVRKGILTSASDSSPTPTAEPVATEAPVINEVRDLPESLEETAKRLAARHQKFYDDFLSVKLDECPKGIVDSWRFYEKVHMEDGRASQLGYVTYLSSEKYDPKSGYTVKFARPFEVSITSSAATSDWADFFGRALSNSARTGIHALAEQLRTSRKVRSDRSPIRYKNITKPDGSKVPRFIPSEPALLSFMVTETLIEQGLLNEDYQVAPLESLILKQLRRQNQLRYSCTATEKVRDSIIDLHSLLVTMPESVTDFQNTWKYAHDTEKLSIVVPPVDTSNSIETNPVQANEPDNQEVVMSGLLCKECGANAVVKRDGCKFCENCGAEGSCG